jgi:Zn-dependent protease with chaperone function
MSNTKLEMQELVHPKEQKYFYLALVVSLLVYIGLLLSLIGFFILAFFLLASLFSHALMLGYIRTNGVRLSPHQFPLVYEKVKELCAKMQIPAVPDVYVLESGGMLNAFATRFFGRNMILLYSSIFELIEEGLDDELNFIIAHELAHIKRNHITKQLLILPSMWIPGIAQAYSRSCEYTCDRLAAHFTQKPQAAKNSLLILAVGKRLYNQVNPIDYFNQIKEESGFFIWLSEKLSTHPPLPKRIDEISIFFENSVAATAGKQQSVKKVLIGGLATAVLLVALAGGTQFAWEKYNLASFSDDLFASEMPPLISAVINGDLLEVNSLLAAGADPNSSHYYDGWSALDWAIAAENLEVTAALLAAGADPNILDYYEDGPLFKAAARGNVEHMEILVNAGADINYQQLHTAWTPLLSAIYSGKPEAVKYLLARGADTHLTDSYGLSPLAHAIKQGNKDIIQLLRETN